MWQHPVCLQTGCVGNLFNGFPVIRCTIFHFEVFYKVKKVRLKPLRLSHQGSKHIRSSWSLRRTKNLRGFLAITRTITAP
jgi:hypothetical protein